MAAVAVSNWAIQGTSSNHIVGDVLCAATRDKRPKRIVITPNTLPPPEQGCRTKATMWATGRTLITFTGGAELTDQYLAMLAGLGWMITVFGGLTERQEGRILEVDGSGSIQTFLHLAQKRVVTTVATQCLEWLPYVRIDELYLYHEDDQWIKASDCVEGTATTGKLISNVITWTFVRRGVIHVTVLQRQITDNMRSS
ncbi:hypothetical protein PHMEG_00012969 [Phytophthora megakarya]|uniref:Uncharacterized protein n=1 Tax=Phytophthora megakarya TaxID=4795 RepID=A0A225W8F4_9STRA|nr:hypothetical protein PHMEG_00012969 [Phytophthora megakarya]